MPQKKRQKVKHKATQQHDDDENNEDEDDYQLIPLSSMKRSLSMGSIARTLESDIVLPVSQQRSGIQHKKLPSFLHYLSSELNFTRSAEPSPRRAAGSSASNDLRTMRRQYEQQVLIDGSERQFYREKIEMEDVRNGVFDFVTVPYYLEKVCKYMCNW